MNAGRRSWKKGSGQGSDWSRRVKWTRVDGRLLTGDI